MPILLSQNMLLVSILPIGAVLCISIFAWKEWVKVFEIKQAAKTFHENSEIYVFRFKGERELDGITRSIYEYEYEGKMEEFRTHRKLNLPADGRVRMGPDPLPLVVSPHQRNPYEKTILRDLIVPIVGPDTVETTYKGLMGHEIAQDYIKAMLLSGAAVLTGFVGFFLQRKIFRALNGNISSRRGR